MDKSVQAKIMATLSRVGKPVVVSRSGTKIGTTAGMEVSSEQVDDTNSLLAQTAMTRKRLMVFPLKQAVQVGDTAVIEKVTYTVVKVEEFRPALVTLYLYLEVM
jgi:hypothetical protein